MNPYILHIIYLIASVTFVVGLKMLSHPDSARKGNLVAAFGMLIAIIGTIISKENISGLIYGLIGASIVIGTIAGWIAAKKVKMTAMPEMVSLFSFIFGKYHCIFKIKWYHEQTIEAACL
jgi:NAD(P) transhydrogenase subunit beta